MTVFSASPRERATSPRGAHVADAFSEGYNMVFTGAAFAHGLLAKLYVDEAPEALLNLVFKYVNGEDLAFNAFVAAGV